MNTKIEVCIKEEETTTCKGSILEEMVAQVLTCQQYEVTQTVRVTGIEIDVLAQHKFTGQTILVECKAWDSALPADVITKLLGNGLLKGIKTCWLVTTGGLSKDAEGIRIEWENAKREGLVFFTQNRIIDLLADSHLIKSVDIICEPLKDRFTMGSEALLMLTSAGMYWIVPVADSEVGLSSSVLAFDATTGRRIVSTDQLNELKTRKNSFSSFQWLGEEPVDTKISEGLKEEYNNIVPVISGDDWTDYRPARPEDFVGRKKILSNIFEFWENVNRGSSNTRLFSIKAPSGMGKSSVVLKAVSIASNNRKYSKKFFVFAVDVRTAVSSRYAEMALKACFNSADEHGFTDVTQRNVTSTTINQFLHNESIQKTLSYLKEQGKTIVIIFDQFEELFSKKELYPLFDSVKSLCNEVDALQGQLVLGFAWKTDLTIPVEHPAYYLWSNLADRRKEFELQQFKPSEIKSAIGLFGKQLQEPVNPILANYLTKQCQGYPWLLKKLCIHVFKLIHEGSSQEYVIGQRLNIVDLFERDISELTPDQHACVLEIAKASPADYFAIAETYGSDMVQALINARVVIRRASKLTLYWDIFRDYVLNHVTPELLLDYIPQLQFGSDIRAFACLLEHGDMTSAELSKQLSVSPATVDNIMIDAVMFGVAQKSNNTIHLIPESKEDLVLQLQTLFKKHVIYSELKQRGVESFDYVYFQKIFQSSYNDVNIKEKTKEMYCSKLYGWLLRLGLLEEVKGRVTIVSTANLKTVFLNTQRTPRRGKYQWGNTNLFWGQSSPDKVIDAYNRIVSEGIGYEDLKSQGYRNAIEALVAAGAITKYGDAFVIRCRLEPVFKNIKETETIKFAQKKMEEHPEIKSESMGILLEEQFSRKWTPASQKRYGNAIIGWVKYLNGPTKI